MLRVIEREAVQRLLSDKAAVTLVEALPPAYYARGHLPGAINVPHDQVRETSARLLPDKSARIIVYCANAPCPNSSIAAVMLESLGYTDVAKYVGGKQDWVEAGLPLEASANGMAA